MRARGKRKSAAFGALSLAALLLVPVPVEGQTQAEPMFCDTENVLLNHRFTPMGGHVDLDGGAYVIEVVDLGDVDSHAGLFVRTYDSVETRTTWLGTGWTDNYQVRIRRNSANVDDLIFTGPDGFWHDFGNGFAARGSIKARSSSATLAPDEGGGFVVTYHGDRWAIDEAGSLTRADYADGSWVEVRYRADTLAESVGPTGVELRFEVDDAMVGHRLARVVDANDPDMLAEYEFDVAGRLVRAATPYAPAYRYTYGELDRLATIEDDSGAVLISAMYDARGRIARLQDAQGLVDGEAEVFTYEEFADGGSRTTVTYPPSRVEPGWHPIQVATHDAEHRMTEERLQPTSTQTFVGRYTYTGDDRLSTDPPCPLPAAQLPGAQPIPSQVSGPLAFVVLALARIIAVFAYLIGVALRDALPVIPI